jgi:chromate reductase, NAD(P)H dehydrogenase (quinone)
LRSGKNKAQKWQHCLDAKVHQRTVPGGSGAHIHQICDGWPMRIVGIAGSLRSASLNAALLRAAADECPPGAAIEIESIREIPLYDGDVEASGLPLRVSELKDRIATADGLLLVSPEYNSSIPGVFKNAIDWLSRPAADIPRVFGGRPVGLIGASPGRFGTVLSQNAWLPVFRTLGLRLWTGQSLYVSGANKVFDRKGKLVDEPTRTRLSDYVRGFVEFAGR